ncbi:MAG TPA: DUF3267 domain-containing protein [Oscillatoriaceae cyanobacterium M33_DOE_052]|nr:DUF3267 domain-containing protein [Oscillatoriaceae cyanobacterium M33_DOE_052]
MKKDVSVSMVKANLYALIAALPPTVILLGCYTFMWGWHRFFMGISYFLSQPLLSLIGLFAGIVAHELIHGLTWKFFGNKPSSAIKYRIDWKTLTPYTHCKEPIEIGAYKLGAAMPGVILGVLPAIFGILTSNGSILTFGLIFTLAAGGDILILWLLRQVKAGALVEDHPTRVGCYVINL